jgi:hypothetical protein
MSLNEKGRKVGVGWGASVEERENRRTVKEGRKEGGMAKEGLNMKEGRKDGY